MPACSQLQFSDLLMGGYAVSLQQEPIVRQQMLIRRPAAKVCEAFVDPSVTTKFWFTKSSGRLEPGKTVTWSWDMYGVSAPVRVLDLVDGRRILVEWGDPATTVEWAFDDRGDSTLVVVVNSGFQGSDDDKVARALDSAGGFSFVLAALKAWLEHGIQLNIVADHHPDGHVV